VKGVAHVTAQSRSMERIMTLPEEKKKKRKKEKRAEFLWILPHSSRGFLWIAQISSWKHHR
jgi:hypothetical protein